MRTILIFCIILLSHSLLAQQRWVRHISGWTSSKSEIKNDTIITWGLGNYDNSNFFIYVNKTKLNGDFISNDSFNYFIPTNDSGVQTTAFLSSNCIIYNKLNNDYQLGISVVKKVTSQYKYQAYLVENSNSLKLIKDLSVDTFNTFINQNSILDNKVIAIVSYKPMETKSYGFPDFKLQLAEKTRVKTILEKNNVEGNSHLYSFEKFRLDNLNSKYLFLNYADQSDFYGTPESWQYYIEKIDTNGNIIWNCNPTQDDRCNSTSFNFTQLPNSNLLCVWNNLDYRPHMNPKNPNQNLAEHNDSCTLWFSEIDYKTGKVLWKKNLNEFLKKYFINESQYLLIRDCKIIDNKYLVFAGYRQLTLTDVPYWKYLTVLLKTDLIGNPIWYREFEMYPSDSGDKGMQCFNVTNANDHGYILTGEYTNQGGQKFPNGCQKATLISLDSFGCLNSGCEKKDNLTKLFYQKDNYSIYPNPANSEINIKGLVGRSWLQIFSMDGKVLIEESGNNEIENINIGSLPDGVYLIYVRDDNGNFNYKFIKIAN